MAVSSTGQLLSSPHRGHTCSPSLPKPGHLHPIQTHLQNLRAILCKLKDDIPEVGAEEEKRSPAKVPTTALPAEQAEGLAWLRAAGAADRRKQDQLARNGC